MKVLLIIWISAVFIQEVIPSTLIRLPQEANRNRSVVQTEYVAKYEQRGKHGNESCGRVFGKHEIVHETCGDNWNSFADKCASLIKDLVASLANTVSSKPGDATNLQVQIKNTFKHFDSTHNCTCTGKLSEIDLSPIFNKSSTSSDVSPDKPSKYIENSKSDSEANDKIIREGSESESKNNDQPTGSSCTDDETCESGVGAIKPNQQQKQSNLQLDRNSQVDPETDESSKDQATNNSRRQITHPKFSTVKPQKSDSSADGSSESSSNYEQPDNKKTPMEFTPAPKVNDLSKSSLFEGPNSFSQPEQSGQSNSYKSLVPPNSSSPNSKTSPTSDSQLLDPQNKNSASQTTKSHESSANQQNLKPMTTPIPQKENEKTSDGDSVNEGRKQTPLTTPVLHYHQPIIKVPMPPKKPTESDSGFGSDENESGSSLFPFHYQPFVRVPISTQQPPSNNGGLGYGILPFESESNSVTKPAAESGEGSKHSSSTTPEATDGDCKQPFSTTSAPSQTKSTKPETTKQTAGSSNILGSETQEPFTSTTSSLSKSESKDPGTSEQPKENTDRVHKQSSSTIPTSDRSKSSESGTGKTSTESNEASGCENQEDPSSTTSTSDQSKSSESGTGKTPTESNEASGCENQEDPSSTTSTSDQSKSSESGTGKQPTESNEASGCENQEDPSSATSTSSHSKSSESDTTQKTSGSTDDLGNDDQDFSSSTKFKNPGTIKTPSETADENPKESSSTSPTSKQPKFSQSVTTKHTPGSTNGLGNEGQKYSDSTTQMPSQSGTLGSGVSKKPKKGNEASGDENQEDSSSNTSTPSQSKSSQSGTTKHTTGSSSNAADEDHKYSYLTTSAPSQSKTTGSGMVKNPSENTDENQTQFSFTVQPTSPILSLNLPHQPIPTQSELTGSETIKLPAGSTTGLGIGDQKQFSSNLPAPFIRVAGNNTKATGLDPTELPTGSTTGLGFGDPKQFSSNLPAPFIRVTGNNTKATGLDPTELPTGSTTGLGFGDPKQSSSNLPVSIIRVPKNDTVDVDNANPEPSSSAGALPTYYGKLWAPSLGEADSQKMNMDTSEKSDKYQPDQYLPSQQERPIIYAPPSFSQEVSGDKSQSYNPITPAYPDSDSPVTITPARPQYQFTIAPEIPGPALKPSQPGALIPGGHLGGEDRHPVYIHPTTYQTTSDEPTTSSGYLPLAENGKPYLFSTSLPTVTYKPMPIKPSVSPKTTEIQEEDEDDEEDCCSCESCTEEEITDPKLFKENACKNLEEARKELKAIFNKIKKKLKCGRKPLQPITSPSSHPLL